MLYRLCRLVCLVLFHVGWRPTIEGREHIPAEGPIVVASNHLSSLDTLIIQLERVLTHARQAPDRARQEVGGRAQKARQTVESRAQRTRRRAVKELDKPLAGADRVRRAARVPGFPITAYDDLSVRQIDRRLQELSRVELRKVRDYERRNKSRKGVLQAVERKLEK